MKGYRKVLIAVNGSKKVLADGLKLAGDERCWVTVVKVIPPFEGDLDLTGVRNIEDLLDSESRKEISEINSAADKDGALIKTRVESGDVPTKIVQVAEEERCDVIVLGAPKHNWLRRFLGDRVVEKVINHAPCPVLVVGS